MPSLLSFSTRSAIQALLLVTGLSIILVAFFCLDDGLKLWIPLSPSVNHPVITYLSYTFGYASLLKRCTATIASTGDTS